MTDKVYVYVVGRGDRGPSKVGISADPVARLSQLQIGSYWPLPLYIAQPFASRTEARLAESLTHRFLSEFRLSEEWFDLSGGDCWGAVQMAIAALLNDPHPSEAVIEAYSTACVCLLRRSGLGNADGIIG